MPSDFKRPFSDHSDARPQTAALYTEACRAGDRSSCWIAATLEHWGTSAAAGMVADNCLAGDILSCRALRMAHEDLPGAMGRSDSCDPGGGSSPCDIGVLRKECLAGFVQSCDAFSHPPASSAPDSAVLKARIPALAQAACQARVEQECFVGKKSPAEMRQALEQMCPLVPAACSGLSKFWLDTDRLHARGLAEQACQYGGDGYRGDCLFLAEDYMDGVFPEPVLGRGAALFKKVCDELQNAPWDCQERTAHAAAGSTH
jgi:hypothetical protein